MEKEENPAKLGKESYETLKPASWVQQTCGEYESERRNIQADLLIDHIWLRTAAHLVNNPSVYMGHPRTKAELPYRDEDMAKE